MCVRCHPGNQGLRVNQTRLCLHQPHVLMAEADCFYRNIKQMDVCHEQKWVHTLIFEKIYKQYKQKEGTMTEIRTWVRRLDYKHEGDFTERKDLFSM